MMDFVYFLGRFHVLALHLPIGIILVAIVLEWVARKEKYRQLEVAAPWLWGAAALTSIFTVVLGYMHFAEGGFDSDAARLHRLFGTSVAVLATGVWLLRTYRQTIYRRVQIGAGLVLLAVVTLTGHYGGALTHGPDFLVEYAPQPLRALAGKAPRRPPVTELAMADPYHDIVAPILQARCESCHNSDKRRGGLDLSSYETLRTGGEDGPVVAPGDIEGSEMVRRVSLSEDDEDFMPAEGKTPLTADQVEILRWWIGAGAPTDVQLADLGVGGEVEPLLARALGLSAGDAQPVVAAADPAAIERLREAGFLIRQVSLDDSRLIVANPSPGRDFGPSELELLAAVAGQLVELDLADSGIEDDEVAAIGSLSSLRSLRLSNNRLTDRAVTTLAALPALETLNVYGNTGITDDSVEVIAETPALARFYVWGTGIGSDGLNRLRQLRPGLIVQSDVDTTIFEEIDAAAEETTDVPESSP